MKTVSSAEAKPIPTLDLRKPVIQITPKEITRNKEIHKRESIENTVTRLDYLYKIEEQLKENLGRPPSRKEVLDQMRIIGFDMSLATLWRDRGRNTTRKSWLRNLMQEGMYSAFQNHSSDILDYIEEKAVEFLNIKWTNSKQVQKTKDDGEGSTEQTITAEVATPKYNFLYILTRVVELRKHLVSGDNIDLSMAMLQEDFQKLREHSEQVEMKNKELENELRQVLKKGGKVGTPPHSTSNQ